MFVAAGALSFALAGALSGQPGDDAPACVALGPVASQTVLDDRHLLLRAEAGHFVLLTTRTRCAGLQPGASASLSFDGEAEVCTLDGAFITPADGWRCAVEGLRPVASEDAARALIAGDQHRNDGAQR